MTPTELRAAVYDRYHSRLWRLWCDRFRARIAAAYPATGGLEIHLHNWYVCGRDPIIAAAALALRDAEWSRWHRIADRGRREYDRAEHRTHGTQPSGYTFRPLWCAACQSAAA